MGWKTDYSGLQIDATLEKGRNLKVVNNGWIVLESSANAPINLDNLKNPGNYVVYHWINGPKLENNVSHLNISVVLINGKPHQFINRYIYTYSRIVYDSSVTEWIIDQAYGALKPGATAPDAVVDGKTLWMDTTNVSAPILKLYIDGAWQEVIPSEAMKISVYDPQGKKSDIFKYIEDALSTALGGSVSIDFTSHTDDPDIHITADEKSNWDNGASTEILDDRVIEIKADIDNEVAKGLLHNISDFNNLYNTINETDETLISHTAKMDIHPSSTNHSKWNNKAAGDHSHNKDGKVKVDPAHVSGQIPIGSLPHVVKERIYSAASESELYAKTKDPIHSGDVFYITNTNGNTWYFLIDDSYLGTSSAANSFKKFVSVVKLWTSIVNTPTTVAGYNITNAATKSDVSTLQNSINSMKAKVSDNIDSSITSIANSETSYNETEYLLKPLRESVNLLDMAINKLATVGE